MKTMTFRQPVLAAAALLMSFTAFSQEEGKFEIAPAADLVSSYVWRGVYQTGASVQPSIALSYAGLSLTAWGSTDFSSMSDPDKGKEFDLTLGYGIGGFSISVTDYWWAGEGKRYGNYPDSHFFEATAGYNFGESFPLGFTWSTMFAGGDKDADGDRQFSTYVEASYAFNVMGVDVTPGIGVSPWTGMYHKEGSEGFALSTISLKASKEIRITDSFSLPIFTQCIVAPNRDNVFLVFGLSIK